MVAERPPGDPKDEGPVEVDSAGVYEGLSAEDLGYGSLPRVGEETDESGGEPAPSGGCPPDQASALGRLRTRSSHAFTFLSEASTG